MTFALTGVGFNVFLNAKGGCDTLLLYLKTNIHTLVGQKIDHENGNECVCEDFFDHGSKLIRNGQFATSFYREWLLYNNFFCTSVLITERMLTDLRTKITCKGTSLGAGS